MLNNILDQAINATSRGPVIVSEQHDASRIHIEAADIDGALASLSPAGRGWDAAEYGITREQARAMIAAADTPENRERVMADLRQRALRRASLDTTNGRVAVMVVGEAPWHRLGVNVESAVRAADAIVLAGLNWSVSKRPMFFVKKDGGHYESAETFAIVRDDTEEQLSSVGARYKPIQNADCFEFLDSLLQEFGARYHTAGAIYGGGKVWMQCELPEHNFEVVVGDRVQTFATFSNPHDASGKAYCYPTTNRIVCANTFRTASRDRSKGLGIRHTGEVKASIGAARQVLGLAIHEIDQFKENACEMARMRVEPEPFFEDLLDCVCKVTQAQAEQGADALAAVLKVTDAERELKRKTFEREIARREGMLEEILQKYEGEKNGVAGIRGTRWSAFNAVTEYADHRKPQRQMGSESERLSRRFESVLTGEADDLKQTAYQMLTTSRA